VPRRNVLVLLLPACARGTRTSASSSRRWVQRGRRVCSVRGPGLRYLWSLNDLGARYSGIDLFLAGSLVEPTSVAYNAVIECAGASGPATTPSFWWRTHRVGGGRHHETRGRGESDSGGAAESARNSQQDGSDYVIDPTRDDVTEKVLFYTGGLGAALYLEATGLPDKVLPVIEDTIWYGK